MDLHFLSLVQILLQNTRTLRTEIHHIILWRVLTRALHVFFPRFGFQNAEVSKNLESPASLALK